MFYLAELKMDEASSEKFMKFPERVTNFVFLENDIIKRNHFLRYFLFNNSILRISLKVNDELKSGYFPASETYRKLESLCSTFEGTVKISKRSTFYKQKFGLRFLSQRMDFQTLDRVKMQELSVEDQDKLWIIKYLILVLVRYNYIIPTESEVGEIIKCIENNKKSENIDCYLYVLWRTATNMEGYNDEK